jgi:hypothetical protein
MEDHGRGCSNIQSSSELLIIPSSLFFVFEKRLLHFGYLSRNPQKNEKSVTAGRRYAKSATQTVVLQY